MLAVSAAWLLHAAAGCSEQGSDGTPGVSGQELVACAYVAESRSHVMFAAEQHGGFMLLPVAVSRMVMVRLA
jgi:hypothetical protein